MNHNEFDQYIKNYRQNLDAALFLSGETSDFFAQYKAKTLYQWFSRLSHKPIAILDYGCGDGLMTAHVKKYFCNANVSGTDISPDSISYAIKKHPNISFTLIKNETLAYQENSFDLVYAAGVFHHIPSQQQKIYLEEIIRVLKPGGYCVLFELNPYNPLTQITFKRCPIDKHAIMLSPGKTKRMLKKYGITKTKYCCFFPAPFKRLRMFEKFLSWLPLGALYACILTKQKDYHEKI